MKLVEQLPSFSSKEFKTPLGHTVRWSSKQNLSFGNPVAIGIVRKATDHYPKWSVSGRRTGRAEKLRWSIGNMAIK
jgi:hypothetical protein